MKQTIPQRHHRTPAQTPLHLRVRCVGCHRWLRHQPRIQSHHVGIAGFGKRGKGKHWVERMAIARNTLAHGTLESLVRPGAYARLHIGRQVGGKHRAKRRVHGPTTSVEHAVCSRMTTCTIAQGRQLLATLQHIGAVVRWVEVHRWQGRTPTHNGRTQRKHTQSNTRDLLPPFAPALPQAGLCAFGWLGNCFSHGRRCWHRCAQRTQSSAYHLGCEWRVAKANTRGIKNCIGNGSRAWHRGGLTRTQRHIVTWARHLHHINDRHLAEIQNRVAAPVLADHASIVGIGLHFFEQSTAGGLQHIAMHLLLNAFRVDHQACIMPNHHPLDVHFTGVSVHFDICDPG